MTTPPTPPALDGARRAELVRLAKAATPGPWTVEISNPDRAVEVYRRDDALAFVCGTGFKVVGSSGADAAFIAACSPDVILALCAALEADEADTQFARCSHCGSEDLLCLNCRTSVNAIPRPEVSVTTAEASCTCGHSPRHHRTGRDRGLRYKLKNPCNICSCTDYRAAARSPLTETTDD